MGIIWPGFRALSRKGLPVPKMDREGASKRDRDNGQQKRLREREKKRDAETQLREKRSRWTTEWPNENDPT